MSVCMALLVCVCVCVCVCLGLSEITQFALNGSLVYLYVYQYDYLYVYLHDYCQGMESIRANPCSKLYKVK